MLSRKITNTLLKISQVPKQTSTQTLRAAEQGHITSSSCTWASVKLERSSEIALKYRTLDNLL